MNSAEFKTMREAVGLSVAEAADLFCVEPRTIRHWESGRNSVPEGVASEITAIDSQLDFIVSEALRVYWEQKPDEVVLYRYRDIDELIESQGNFNGWPVSVHAAMLFRAKKLFAHNKIPCQIRYKT